jgi:hypothetical protein
VSAGAGIDPASDSSTVFDIAPLDAVAGTVIIGLLTEGTDTRYARIVEALGDRQVLPMRLDGASEQPDAVRRLLGVPAGNEAYFGWTVAAIRDPDGGNLHCSECARHAGVRWEHGVRVAA